MKNNEHALMLEHQLNIELAAENKQLKELNRELLEGLIEAVERIKEYENQPLYIVEQLEPIIKKATL